MMNHFFEMPESGELPVTIFESSLNSKKLVLRQSNENIDDGPDMIYIPKDYLGQFIEFLSGALAQINEEHDWQCVDPGEYDSLYECSRCQSRHMHSIDDPETDLRRYGCKAVQS